MMNSPQGSSGSGKEVRDSGVPTSSFDDDGGVLWWSVGSGEPSYGVSGSWGSSSGDRLGAASFRWAR
jgi:hypothetical protein